MNTGKHTTTEISNVQIGLNHHSLNIQESHPSYKR